ncbi:polysaccharide export outer membrane protein [Haloferula luteola]|uniref:Polysaccharide export outer membrane protein n=1 Tax=Haloferula luteola TaxID=595692 RepID=A0A840VBV5_9BACT|nr:polysaccharide biosynthesis/export family protein [Haloferula luteola]MBB5350361.1 polysaccharide export outer membrane protein [Haloferula luteola]
MKFLLTLLCLFVAFGHQLQAQTTIQAGRAIEIRIVGVPPEEAARVNNTYPVSEGGYVRMPYIGNVRAAGLRPEALAQSIEASYRAAKIYTSPTIQVISSSDETLTELMLTVGGYVRKAGPVKYFRGLTLYNAVQAAGGANEFGSMHRVRLLRDGKVKEYDLTEIASKTVAVEPNDTIEVPQKNIFGR